MQKEKKNLHRERQDDLRQCRAVTEPWANTFGGIVGIINLIPPKSMSAL